MDKVQKFEYTQQIEQYMEENQVYELFESLLKSLLLTKPDKPLDHLISALQSEPLKRIFLMGPPGSFRQENALFLAEHFGWQCITTGDLLRKEVSKKSEIGKQIQDSFKNYHYVDDKIVVDLVSKVIEDCEANKQSWIIQGFPRTKVQALALQKMGVIPDKLILLKVKSTASLARLKNNLISVNQSLYGPELEDLAQSCLQEYELNMRGVNSAFQQFIFEHNAEDKAQSDVANELGKLLKLRFRSNAPRRPPRVILLGPPGSGRQTQCTAISQFFGLVEISMRQLLKQEIQNNPEHGKIISDCTSKGDPVPDDIVNFLLENRLRQSDCRINGWVLEGFPETNSQINLLKAMRIKPSLVVALEQTEEESTRRLGNRRIDPHTGALYNLEVNPPSDETTSTRLIEAPEDKYDCVKKRYAAWTAALPLIEESFKLQLVIMQADRPVEQMTEAISDAIQNPI